MLKRGEERGRIRVTRLHQIVMNLSKNTFDKSHNKMNEKYATCTLM